MEHNREMRRLKRKARMSGHWWPVSTAAGVGIIIGLAILANAVTKKSR